MLRSDFFTTEFFQAVELTTAADQAWLLPHPKDDLCEFLDKHYTDYVTQLQTLLKVFRQWCQSHYHAYAMAEQSLDFLDNVFVAKPADDYSKKNFHNTRSDLYVHAPQLINAINCSLTDSSIDQHYKVYALTNFFTHIQAKICIPGLNIHLTNLAQTLQFNLGVALMHLRRELAEQVAYDVLVKHNYIDKYDRDGVSDIHKINTLVNMHRDIYGLTYKADFYVTPGFRNKLLADFQAQLNKLMSLETIIEHILQNCPFLEDFLAKNPHTIASKDIEILQNWLAQYGQDPDFSLTSLFYDDENDAYEWKLGIKYYFYQTLLQRLINSGYVNQEKFVALALPDNFSQDCSGTLNLKFSLYDNKVLYPPIFSQLLEQFIFDPKIIARLNSKQLEISTIDTELQSVWRQTLIAKLSSPSTNFDNARQLLDKYFLQHELNFNNCYELLSSCHSAIKAKLIDQFKLIRLLNRNFNLLNYFKYLNALNDSQRLDVINNALPALGQAIAKEINAIFTAIPHSEWQPYIDLFIGYLASGIKKQEMLTHITYLKDQPHFAWIMLKLLLKYPQLSNLYSIIPALTDDQMFYLYNDRQACTRLSTIVEILKTYDRVDDETITFIFSHIKYYSIMTELLDANSYTNNFTKKFKQFVLDYISFENLYSDHIYFKRLQKVFIKSYISYKFNNAATNAAKIINLLTGKMTYFSKAEQKKLPACLKKLPLNIYPDECYIKNVFDDLQTQAIHAIDLRIITLNPSEVEILTQLVAAYPVAKYKLSSANYSLANQIVKISPIPVEIDFSTQLFIPEMLENLLSPPINEPKCPYLTLDFWHCHLNNQDFSILLNKLCQLTISFDLRLMHNHDINDQGLLMLVEKLPLLPKGTIIRLDVDHCSEEALAALATGMANHYNLCLMPTQVRANLKHNCQLIKRYSERNKLIEKHPAEFRTILINGTNNPTNFTLPLTLFGMPVTQRNSLPREIALFFQSLKASDSNINSATTDANEERPTKRKKLHA